MIRAAALLLSLALAPEPSYREATLKSAIAQAESDHQPDRLDHALLELAQYLEARGRYREAEPLYARSKDINQSAHGEHSIEAATGLLRLGTVYHAEFRYKEAEAVTRQAAAILESLAGPDSLEFSITSANLATMLADQGQFDRAEPVLRRALYIIRKHVPATDPAIFEVEASLGLVYLRQGELYKAEPLLQASFERSASSSALAALAELYIAQRRWPEAEARIRQASNLSPEDPCLAGILHLRAVVEAHLGDHRQASADMKRSIELLESIAGPESLALAPLLDDYVLFLRHSGRKREASAAFRRAKAIRHSQ